MTTLTYVDAFMTIIGLYMIYTAVKMKKSGNIPSMVLSPEEHKKLKDKKKFIEMIYGKFLMFSIVMTILGIVGIISDEIMTIPYFSFVELGVFFVVFFIFTRAYQDARSECTY